MSSALYDAFRVPPTNHLPKGGFQSKVLVQGENQERFLACSFQNEIKSELMKNASSKCEPEKLDDYYPVFLAHIY